jgi:ubiquinone/menaquinone biosynthesis C-methylase UbiE
MHKPIDTQDLLWKNISVLPYFRGFLRSIEGKYFRELQIENPVLDLGCGDGHFSAQTFTNNRLQGIDPSYKSLLSAKSYIYYSGLICAKGNYLPFKNHNFKNIISNSVLEHIPDVDSVICEVARVLQRHGKFMITVPNSNFTKNLSVALFFEKFRLRFFANIYRRFFNCISRHQHPDPTDQWLERLKKQGFVIIDYWNYFPPSSLKILEWGHYFGLPFWLNLKIFGRFILNPNKSNYLLRQIYFWLYPKYEREQKSLNGAYTFIVAEKQ